MPKVYTKEVREKARKLRKRGWSIGENNREMKIPKNTLSGWVKDIRLSKNQMKCIEEKMLASAAVGRIKASGLLREKMEKWKEGIRNKVKHFRLYASNDPDAGKLICGLLYLCEGAKYPNSRYLHFGNTDPAIISIFINLLRKHFNIDEAKLRFDISYRWDQNYNELKYFWSKITNIPVSKALNNKPDKRTKGKPTMKKGYMGICRIIYYSTSLQFELQSIGEAIIKRRI